MSKKVIAAVIVILAILGAAALINQNANKPKATPMPAGASSTPDSGVILITFDGASFMPAETTVQAGSQIRFTNRSSDAVDVDSDPHPAHTSDADLNLGLIPAGESKTVTVTKTGSFGIHDHLNPSITAKITVQ